MRVIHVACDAEVLDRVQGREHALGTLRRRSGRAYDPEVVAAFLKSADVLLTAAEPTDPWDAWLQANDSRAAELDGETLDRAFEVVADFADLKSPFTPGHSRGVAQLATEAGRASGPAADDLTLLRRAALVRDLGRVCVPNSIWDKPGPLTRTERERMEHCGRVVIEDRPGGLWVDLVIVDVVDRANERVSVFVWEVTTEDEPIWTE